MLGFVDGKATDAIDYGYDASSFDNLPNDIYFYTEEWKLIIQGVGSFDTSSSYAIGVKTDGLGKVKFMIDELENFDPNQPIYIHDTETDTYHDVRTNPYEVTLPAGENQTRFSLRFTDKTLGTKDDTFENAIAVHYTQINKILNISNNSKDNTIQSVSLYDMQGKAIANRKVEDKEQTNMKIQMQSMTSGVYIVKLKTMKGNISKKIIVR